MITWAKTLLTSYRYLERVAKAIDKIVMTRAINSFYTSGSNLSFNSITNVSSDILSLTERKVNLINLKLILQEALESVSENHSALLVSSFVEGKNCYECAEVLSISLRTFFRRQNQALESFVKALALQSCDEKFFDDMLAGEGWIAQIKLKYSRNSSYIEPDGVKIENKIKLKQKADSKQCAKVQMTKDNETESEKKQEKPCKYVQRKQTQIVEKQVSLQTHNILHF